MGSIVARIQAQPNRGIASGVIPAKDPACYSDYGNPEVAVDIRYLHHDQLKVECHWLSDL